MDHPAPKNLDDKMEVDPPQHKGEPSKLHGPKKAETPKNQEEATAGDRHAPDLREVPPHLLQLARELEIMDKLLRGETHPGITMENLVTQAARYACMQVFSGRRSLPVFTITTKSREEWIHKLVEYTKLPIQICASYMVASQDLQGI